jgi:hypothetical protein
MKETHINLETTSLERIFALVNAIAGHKVAKLVASYAREHVQPAAAAKK